VGDDVSGSVAVNGDGCAEAVHYGVHEVIGKTDVEGDSLSCVHAKFVLDIAVYIEVFRLRQVVNLGARDALHAVDTEVTDLGITLVVADNVVFVIVPDQGRRG